MRISLLTSSHSHYDDRIYHHMAKSLMNAGHRIEIISSMSNLNIDGSLSIKSFNGNAMSKFYKICTFLKKLSLFNPEVIICSEPLTTIAAYKYSKKSNVKVIYDITEWYPSKKNLRNHYVFTRYFHFIKYVCLNIYAHAITDGFIFGEYYKSLIARVLFSGKPYKYISYYPSRSLFKSNAPNKLNEKLHFSYSGPISKEKGFLDMLNVLICLKNKHPDIEINLKIIGEYVKKDEKKCRNILHQVANKINVKYFEEQPLEIFLDLIQDTDIFLDLRSSDIENSHCLPIKLFYYIALRRPVIFSNLKAIKKTLDITKFGYLVAPSNTNKIVSLISTYIKDQDLYIQHCNHARKLHKTNFNWEKIEKKFLDYIDNLL